MREILFRGFHPDEEGSQYVVVDGKRIRGRWVEGYLIITPFGEWLILLEGDDWFSCTPCVVIPETVGQYTGLTDKNGKKIFEGDVLQVEYPTSTWWGKVSFIQGYFSVDNLYWNRHAAIDIVFYYGSTEIIGNIHNNPELIEEKIWNLKA